MERKTHGNIHKIVVRRAGLRKKVTSVRVHPGFFAKDKEADAHVRVVRRTSTGPS